MKRFYLESYGCQMNKSDSDKIMNSLNNLGLGNSVNPEEADCIIINTCSVRRKAELKVFNRLNFFKHLKNRNPDLKLFVCGCMAQWMGQSLISEFDFIDYVLGPSNLNEIENIIKREPGKGCEPKGCEPKGYEPKGYEPRQVVTDMKDYLFQESVQEKDFPFKAYINITHGCSNFCSYCIVPFVRGPVISDNSFHIFDQVKRLADLDVSEIELLGQNVNFFGLDNGDINLSKLLERLSSINGIKRIRFTTSHPKDFSNELIDAIFGLKKVCKHIHLPLQSGSDRVLESMNREYSMKDYYGIVEKIRSKSEEFSITTDLLVGFPGETENDFLETLSVVSDIMFDDAFMYKYSPRPFIRAEKFPFKVDEEIKTERLKKLIELQIEISKKRGRRFVGSELEILVEKSGKKKDELLGRTEYNNMVIVNSEGLKPGDYILTEITSIKGKTLIGIGNR